MYCTTVVRLCNISHNTAPFAEFSLAAAVLSCTFSLEHFKMVQRYIIRGVRHIVPVARVLATESRRNRLYFTAYVFLRIETGVFKFGRVFIILLVFYQRCLFPENFSFSIERQYPLYKAYGT